MELRLSEELFVLALNEKRGTRPRKFEANYSYPCMQTHSPGFYRQRKPGTNYAAHRCINRGRCF